MSRGLSEFIQLVQTEETRCAVIATTCHIGVTQKRKQDGWVGDGRDEVKSLGVAQWLHSELNFREGKK